jgi:predicted peroxiredoxin
MLFMASHGEDAPERAIVPWIMAATAAVSGQDVVVVCTVDAVSVGIDGWAAGVETEGMPVLEDLFRQVVAGGGEVWLCSACCLKRGITGGSERDGTTIVGTARIVEAIAEGGIPITPA